MANYDVILDLNKRITLGEFRHYQEENEVSLEELHNASKCFIDKRNNIIFLFSDYMREVGGNKFNFVSYADYIRTLANPELFGQDKWKFNYIDAGFVPIYMLPTFYDYNGRAIYREAAIIKPFLEERFGKSLYEFPYSSFKSTKTSTECMDLYMKKYDVAEVFKSTDGNILDAKLSTIVDEVVAEIFRFIEQKGFDV